MCISEVSRLKNITSFLFLPTSFSLQWQIPADRIPHGSFELVLGISSMGLDLNAVDCLTFDIVYGTNQNPSRHNEVHIGLLILHAEYSILQLTSDLTRALIFF